MEGYAGCIGDGGPEGGDGKSGRGQGGKRLWPRLCWRERFLIGGQGGGSHELGAMGEGLKVACKSKAGEGGPFVDESGVNMYTRAASPGNAYSSMNASRIVYMSVIVQ